MLIPNLVSTLELEIRPPRGAHNETEPAVLYQLTVIGEAVKRLSKEFRAKSPEIPWQLIAGMRNNLIHGYDLTDWDEVWKTSTTDVPDLLAMLESHVGN